MSARVWPVIFIGHGTPLNAIETNAFTEAWTALGSTAGQPKAILMISGHWCTHGTQVTAMNEPETLYHFGYQNLYQIKYRAPGSPALASHITELLAPTPVALDHKWGFDHGSWLFLTRAFPAANIPVVQLSLDLQASSRHHFELGRRLRPLRQEDVLIVASGNIVHNLELAIRRGPALPYNWATRFDELVREKLLERDWASLIDYPSLSPDAALAAPTPDHYLPLLYALGAASVDESVTFPVAGIDRGSMSMRSILFGTF
jgi:4,5-DOPA dioxygenase extradiol